MREPRFVTFEGPSGAGKSTLAESMVGWLGSRGAAVDFIPDGAIFERPDFADVARAFETKEFPSTRLMLAAYRRVFDAARRASSWVVMDWSCLAMIEDLPSAQPDRTSTTTLVPGARADPAVLRMHAADVARLALGLCPTLFVLDVAAETAVRRALAQRGAAWFDPALQRTPSLRPDESIEERAVRDQESFDARRRDIVDAHIEAGWRVETIDAGFEADRVLEKALTTLGLPT